MATNKKNKEILLNFEAFVEINNEFAIAASSEFNGLFEVDLSTGHCTFLCMFPGEKINGKRLYTKAICVENKVYFVPASASCIAVYELFEKRISTIRITGSKEKQDCGTKAKFNGAVIYENYIYMTPCTYPGILRINTSTDIVEYFCDWVPKETILFRKSPYVRENKIYLPNTRSNLILEFDMTCCVGKIHYVGEKNNGSWGICGDEDGLWIIPQNPGAVINWIPEMGVVQEYDSYPENFVGMNFLFTKGIIIGESVYLIPAYANMMIHIDKRTGVMSEYAADVFSAGAVTKFMFETATDIYLEIVTENRCKYIKWSLESKTFSEYSFLFYRGIELFKQMYFKHCDDAVKEERYFDLTSFIDLLLLKTCEAKENTLSINIGNMILGELMK